MSDVLNRFDIHDISIHKIPTMSLMKAMCDLYRVVSNKLVRYVLKCF